MVEKTKRTSWRVTMLKVIHESTAKICEDIKQPPDDLELREPAPVRRAARLVAIAVAGALLVIAIVVFAIRIPKLQSVKLSIADAEKLKQVLHDAVNQKQSINCPCQSQSMSWCDVTTFHMYRGAKGASNATFTRQISFTKEAGRDFIPVLCNNTQDPVKETICRNFLTTILNINDTRTLIPTASVFISPQRLYNEIATRIDTNAYEQASAFNFLEVMNKTDDYSYARALTELIEKMKDEFLQNSSSSAEDYWNASREIRANYNVSIGLGMDVSWELYLQACMPSSCDIEYEISVLSRWVRAMGQVGGLSTVITLALKFLIWPSLRFALRFP